MGHKLSSDFERGQELPLRVFGEQSSLEQTELARERRGVRLQSALERPVLTVRPRANVDLELVDSTSDEESAVDS